MSSAEPLPDVRCRRGLGPELVIEEYAWGSGAMVLLERGHGLRPTVFGTEGDDGLRAWDCGLADGHPGDWCMSAVAFEEGWPGPLRVYWKWSDVGGWVDIEEAIVVRCPEQPVEPAEVAPAHEAPVDSTWAVAGEPVVVVALTGDPHRVWVETREVHPKDRRRFIAATGALCCEGSGTEPLSLERVGEERLPRCRHCGEPWDMISGKPPTSQESGRSVMQDHGGPS